MKISMLLHVSVVGIVGVQQLGLMHTQCIIHYEVFLTGFKTTYLFDSVYVVDVVMCCSPL